MSPTRRAWLELSESTLHGEAYSLVGKESPFLGDYIEVSPVRDFLSNG